MCGVGRGTSERHGNAGLMTSKGSRVGVSVWVCACVGLLMMVLLVARLQPCLQGCRRHCQPLLTPVPAWPPVLVLGLGRTHAGAHTPDLHTGAGRVRRVAGCQAGLHGGRRALREREPGPGPGADCDERAGARAQERRLGAAAEHPPHHRCACVPAGWWRAGALPRVSADARRWCCVCWLCVHVW